MMPSVQEPDLALVGVALLVIFGLLIWYDKPVESARPFDPYAQHQDLQTTGYAYESWLWQDPFAFDSISQKKESEFYSVNQKKELEFYFINQKQEHQGQCKHQLDNKIHDIKNNHEKRDVKILAPLLKVRPNTMDIENKELRTRHRYTVIAGLIESGYRPVDPSHLYFCSTQRNKEYDVRWEHFRYEPQPGTDASDKNKIDQLDKNAPDNKPDIIVVWMNSEIFTDDDKFRVMSESLFRSKKISKINFSIYDLNNILDQKRAAKITKRIDEINKNNKIKLKRTGTDDKALAEKLTQELELRNITEPSEVVIITEQDSENVRNLANTFCKSLSDSFAKDKSDTNDDAKDSTCEIRNVFYLKGLDAYQQILHKQDKNEEANKQAARFSAIDLDIPPPLPIGPSQSDYFHRLARQINDVHKEINLKKRDSGIRAVGIFGSDFYDKLLILEALRAEMPNILVFTTDLDAQMLHPPHWLSTRNLVVASHFNLLLKDKDKEQYRKQCEDEEKYQKQFPTSSACLAYYDTVASLSAGVENQKRFPAFRDSQQTNIFFRTINIVKNDADKPEITLPQIFEIGRNGFTRLPHEKNEDLKYHPPDNTLEQAELRLGLLIVIIVFLILFHYEFRPESGESSILLRLGTLAILAVTLFAATDELGEPFSFTDGVSLWPTIFIQIVAVLLAFAFVWFARRDLDRNFCHLSKKYSTVRVPQYFPFYAKECKCKSWLNPLDKLSIPPLILLIFTIAIYAINDVNPDFLPFWLCLWLLVPTTLFYFRIVGTGDFVSIKDWMEEDNCPSGEKNWNTNFRQVFRDIYKGFCVFFDLNNRSVTHSGSCQEKYEDCLWREYYNYGLPEHRISRVVGIWLFFAIIETILIYLVPPWPMPCRGHTCGWASWTGVLSFSVSMILLFFVLDAVRLNYYWIKKLRTQHPLLQYPPPNDTIATNQLQSLENIVAVVAERTEVVDKLIYYPMLGIMLMLFARITYFDNQDFPLSKGITFAASISLLFFSGFILRYEAEQLKRSVIQCAENLGKNNKRVQSEARKVIKKIKGICEGAFEPMFEQPVLRALLIILASVGLFVGEYLKLFE